MTTATTLYGHLLEWAGASPDRPLVIEPLGTSEEHRTVTASALAQRATDLAALLAARGVGNGDCVAVWLPSWADSYAWQFAASAVGAHVIGVNTRYNVTEIAHVLGKRAVAEQAETDAQLEHLRAIGVDYAQGNVFQRPQPIETFFGVARAASRAS